MAFIVEAHAVDDSLVLNSAGKGAASDCRACGNGVTVPTSTKPNPMRQHRIRHLRILVETRRKADGIGKFKPKHLAPQKWRSDGSTAKSADHI